MNKAKSASGILGRIRQRARVQPMAQSIEELALWYQSPMGKTLLATQKRILAQELQLLFGYHLMQLSVVPETRLYSASRVNHCFSLAPKAGFRQSRVSATSDCHALPFADESIDVTLIHHVLEFSENPQQVLKEAARVTIPRGYIVLMGFNPLSLTGMNKFFMQYLSAKKIWCRHGLRVGRIKDWLGFLDFSTAPAQYAFFNLPVNSKKYIHNTHFTHRLDWTRKIPLGGIYCLVARKDKMCMTPMKPAWESTPVAASVAAQKRAIKSVSSTSAMILPLRRRNPENKSE